MILPARTVAAAAVADHYDDLDWVYREVWGEHVHHGLWRKGNESVESAVEALTDLVAHHARIGPGTRVCDIGCGYGASARRWARRFGAAVTGITISTAQYEYAIAALQPGDSVELVRGDWLDLRFEPESFDAVVAIESTEHMLDKVACFAAARRVLRRGGRLVVCAWLAAERPRPWQVRRLLAPICTEGRLGALCSESEYRALVAAAGMKIEGVEDLSRSVARTWSLCIGRTLRRIATDPRIRRYLLARGAGRNRDFFRTLFRLRLAYAVGAMRYGLFHGVRP